jgi:hypothetical protein
LEDQSPTPVQEDSYATISVSRAAEVSTETLVDGDPGEEWLRNNIMVQYWKGQGQGCVEEQSRHSSSNLLRDWYVVIPWDTVKPANSTCP